MGKTTAYKQAVVKAHPLAISTVVVLVGQMVAMTALHLDIKAAAYLDLLMAE
jgi:hypothetical protein